MDKISELLSRGVANVIPGKEELEKLLRSGKKLNVYLGIDPTATQIHLGHAVPLRKLQKFAELGHNVTFLIGDFTALIGDTSDKDSERPVLTPEEIEKNFQTYKKQAEKILDFSKVKIRHNSEWLNSFDFKKVIELCHQFSLNDFISRELIKKRLLAGKRIGLHETFYPLMQGYDSFILETDVQIGGTDQTFNMQAGRTLQKKLRDKESFVLATEFLTGTDGRKMSKTWDNAIWLTDEPDQMYAKVMAIDDELIAQYLTLGTSLSLEEVEKIKEETKGNPLMAKKKLAWQIVSELHDKNSADKASAYFEKTVQQKELPKDLKTMEIKLTDEMTITEVLIKAELTSSRSEAKRLIEQGGVSVDDEVITNPNASFKGAVIKVGRRKFLKIKTSR